MKSFFLILISFSFSVTNAQFNVSYKAGYIDSNYKFVGGTELRVLCKHKNLLFAGTETWKDTVSLGSSDPYVGAQILRLETPTGQWKLDKHYDTQRNNPQPGQRTLFRNEGVTALESITFVNDSLGVPLPSPVTILIAACRDFNGIPSVYTRDDITGIWIETQIAPLQTTKATIRSLTLYRDKTNNADLVFAGCLPQGLIAGVYNASLPGKIRWRIAESTASNTNIGVAGSGSWQGRPMAFTECNGSLYCAVAPIILKRNDVTKTWSEVVRYPLSVTPGGSSGLRGLTTVPNPTGTGQSMISALEGGNGAMYRTTPTANIPYSNIPPELNIMSNLTTAWSSILPAINASYVVVANSEMTPIVDPQTGENCLIITIQHHPALARDDAFYYIRRQNGTNITYQLMRINNNLLSPLIVLNSTRACQLSPFPSDNNNFVYIGGFDADDNWTHNSAYVLRTSVNTLFGYGSLGLVENVTNEVNNGLLIYPNPAINEFIIETLKNNWLNANATLFDLSGKIINKYLLTVFGENRIDIRGFQKGTYLVKISSEKETFTKKIIIN